MGERMFRQIFCDIGAGQEFFVGNGFWQRACVEGETGGQGFDIPPEHAGTGRIFSFVGDFGFAELESGIEGFLPASHRIERDDAVALGIKPLRAIGRRDLIFVHPLFVECGGF